MEQRSAEWHALRKSKIGASDSIVLMGVAPPSWNKTVYDLWLEKTSDEVTVKHVNPYMQRGIELESEALKAFENATGYLMRPMVLISPRNQFMMASLDGFEIDGLAAVEIKCPGQKDHECALDGQIPEKYIPQLQHQIEVTGLPKIYYMSYSPDHVKPFCIKEVYRDSLYILNLIAKECEFYHNHMLTGIPPDHIVQYNEMVSNEWKLLSDEYLRLDRQEKESSQRKKEIKNLLLQISGAQNAIGNGIILQKIERKGTIPYENILEIKQMNLEKYRKPGSSYWQVKESNNEMD